MTSHETINQDGSVVLIEAVYYRYHSVYVEEHDTIEEAQSYLDGGADDGQLAAVGVYVEGRPHSVRGFSGWEKPEGPTLAQMEDEYVKAHA